LDSSYLLGSDYPFVDVVRTLLLIAFELALLGAIVAIYFLPTIVARRREVPILGSVAVINLFLGWTLIGWVVSLAMAVRSVATVTQPQQSIPPPPRYRECPHCKEEMRRDASVCPHCQRDSRAWVLNDGVWWVQDGGGGWHWLDEHRNEWIQAQRRDPAPGELTEPPQVN